MYTLGIILLLQCADVMLTVADKQWKLSVYTSDRSMAGTGADVYITVYGMAQTSSNLISLNPIHVDGSGNNLERGSEDVYLFNGAIRAPTTIKIKVNGMGWAFGVNFNDWHLEKVVIVDLAGGGIYRFPYNKWINDDGSFSLATNDKKLTSTAPPTTQLSSTTLTYTSVQSSQKFTDRVYNTSTILVESTTDISQNLSRVPTVRPITDGLELGNSTATALTETSNIGESSLAPTRVNTQTVIERNSSIRPTLSTLSSCRCVRPKTHKEGFTPYAKEIQIQKKETMSFKRKYTCSEDGRSSSKALGTIACVVISTVVITVVASDISRFATFLK